MRHRKLTAEQVRIIRAWKPQPSLNDLARQFGVAKGVIWKVRKWESYKDIRS